MSECYFGFRLARRFCRLYGIKKDNTGLYRTKQKYLGLKRPNRNIKDYEGLYKTNQEKTGTNLMMQDYTGRYRIIMCCIGLYETIYDYTDYIGLYLTILD